MSLRFGILTISDRSALGERDDSSGPALESLVVSHGWKVELVKIVPDEASSIQETLVDWSDTLGFDVILTTGGTGFAPRDVTPEATIDVLQRSAPGIAEAMRTASLKVTPHAMLSRAVAGIRGKTLIINLPGSPKAAVENLTAVVMVLPHAVELLQDDPQSEAGHEVHR
jgi:molybdenum cofactor synthesis domain-containing protein